jgi:N-acetylmuramoyl-L-alanine amidase
MATGADLIRLAKTRIGEKYLNVLVPKNNPNWHGPWDCAEFASWLVYQTAARLYGCTDNAGDPASTEAYSGAWVRDVQSGALTATDASAANNTPGVILIRRPPLPGKMGHIAVADGAGGTVEAAGVGLGVRRDKVQGRLWHSYARVPGISYAATSVKVKPEPLPFLLTLKEPRETGPLVKRVQAALNRKGINAGKVDGIYGPLTVAAVAAFQQMNRLVADGTVGPRTAKKLGVKWPSGSG